MTTALLLLALVLACPLLMTWMMRGHGHGGCLGHGAHIDNAAARPPIEPRGRDELDSPPSADVGR